ncbi:MAG: T9SS C-terminal target domain-containing protein [Calditrichaeota bacterium]|nr:MAG: T9SS C-terminal target domain-containing protein [Calditrichota bacterium]
MRLLNRHIRIRLSGDASEFGTRIQCNVHRNPGEAMYHIYRKIGAALLFMLMAGSASGLAQGITFRQVADSLGIAYMYNETFWGGGVSFCDFDNDGLEDLSLPSQTGEPIYLYKNYLTGFSNVTAQFGIVDTLRSKTLLWADYDNDGDLDLFIGTRDGRNSLYRHDGGNLFTDVTVAAGLPAEATPTIAACWGDYDNDGRLDLYVTHYNLTMPNRLYRNNGDGTFTDVTFQAGVDVTFSLPLAVSFVDFNNDGWQDIYIANDEQIGNVLLKNLGNGTFVDVSVASGADLHYFAMGIAIGDYDNDGDLDMYVSNGPDGNGLLRNNGDETFTEVADSLGVAVYKTCWGVNFFDYDNDSDLDLYVSVSEGSPDNVNPLFENLGNGTFAPTSGMGMDNDTSRSFGNAIGDYNNDGYCDIAVLNIIPTPFSLWENSGGGNHWIKIELQGVEANRDGIGSVIEIYRQGSRIIRSAHCGISYLSQNSPVFTVGVGAATVVDSLIVRWPGPGFTVDVIRNVAVDQRLRIVEGQGVVSLPPEPPVASDFRLSPNFPNPFNPVTNVEFEIRNSEWVRLTIYDLFGREVKTLVNARKAAGNYTVQWDGTDNVGRPVGSGIYLYRLKAGSFIQTRKMVLVR